MISERLPAVAVPLSLSFTHQLIGSFFLMTAPVLAPVLAERADLPTTLIGLYTSVAYIAAMTASGLSGHAFEKLGALTTSTICILIALFGMALLFSRTPLLLGLSALILGFGYGPLTPASSHVLAAHSPPLWKNTVLAIKQTGVPVGGTLAAVTLPALVLTLGWTWGLVIPCVVSALTALALLPACRRIDASTPSPRMAMAGSKTTSSGHRRWILTLGAGAFCYAGVQMSLTAFLGLYFVEYIGLSLAAAGGMIAVFQVSGLVTRLVWGALADRLGSRVPFFTLIGLLIIGAIWGFLSLAQPGAGAARLLAATLLLGTFGNSWTGLYFAEIVRAVPLSRMGPTMGVALMFTFAGVVVMPPTIGLILSFTGYVTAFAIIGLLGVFGATAGYASRRTDRQH